MRDTSRDIEQQSLTVYTNRKNSLTLGDEILRYTYIIIDKCHFLGSSLFELPPASREMITVRG